MYVHRSSGDTRTVLGVVGAHKIDSEMIGILDGVHDVLRITDPYKRASRYIKPDDTNVYAQLNRTVPYREDELAWLRIQASSNKHFASAPFRVVAMHQGDWGWLPDNGAAWTALANQSGVDLVISGHDHAFSYQAPDKAHAYHRLVLGQDQLARVDATERTLVVKVITDKGAPVHTLIIPSRR